MKNQNRMKEDTYCDCKSVIHLRVILGIAQQ